MTIKFYFLKTYNQTNFFKHTFCEFKQVDDFIFPENENYKSKSESAYYYTEEGVYRKSNHWGRVANCRWKLISNENYKNQNTVIGFAKWSDFYPINSSEKIFFIDVNFENKSVKIRASNANIKNQLATFSNAQKKVKKIQQLFKNEQWSTYFEEDIDVLRKKIILDLINTNKTLAQIKSHL